MMIKSNRLSEARYIINNAIIIPITHFAIMNSKVKWLRIDLILNLNFIYVPRYKV